jgi:exodeoxyribonuclease VII small subunit
MDGLSFEDALAQLEGAVQKLESPGLKLDEALAVFRSGVELAALCDSKLAGVQQEIQKISENAQGEISLQPLAWPEDGK